MICCFVPEWLPLRVRRPSVGICRCVRPCQTGFNGCRTSVCQDVDAARNAIIVCGDSVKSSYWYLDCSAAAQNILLAAESLGFGAVWTAAYPYEDRMQVVRKYTGLPENILPLCVIPFGYPATKENPKQKFDEKKIHYNQY